MGVSYALFSSYESNVNCYKIGLKIAYQVLGKNVTYHIVKYTKIQLVTYTQLVILQNLKRLGLLSATLYRCHCVSGSNIMEWRRSFENQCPENFACLRHVTS